MELWIKQDIIELLEYRIVNDIATQEENMFYEDYKWFNKFDETSNVFKSLVLHIENENNK
ncbi:hypothetical protein MH122_13775 [Bacillus pumilus]|uniref:Uncharacterized protein n=1 Tax=Bacillus pumilus TaxID=1408 RepID=A0AB34QQ92_BACPU|nr:hypothetical protein [Bacillus pumilus]KIL12219.1 hypothetical protein B4127_1550 [Bacillus pumilus]MCY7679867.1 hypothetical protein [Bacillus pumilus]